MCILYAFPRSLANPVFKGHSISLSGFEFDSFLAPYRSSVLALRLQK